MDLGSHSNRNRSYYSRAWALAGVCVLAPNALPARQSSVGAPATLIAATSEVSRARWQTLSDNQCAACHAFERETSHPVGVLAPLQSPADLPLVDGRITCFTCHDELALAGHEHDDAAGNPMLRRDPYAEGLCTACHSIGTALASPHATGMLSAHTGQPTPAFLSGAAGIDEPSASCMACHDGAIAGDAGGHQTRRLSFEGRTEHPIGVDLRDRNVGQPDEMLLVSESALDSRVRLFDGKVGCGSCHNQYSSRENLLVMSNDQSRLCLACHIQ